MDELFWVVVLVPIISFVGIVYGEVQNVRWLRIVSTLVCIASTAFLVTIVTLIGETFALSIRMSEASHGFLEAADKQMAAGHHELVAQELARAVQTTAPTYESGGVIAEFEKATQRLMKGPVSDAVEPKAAAHGNSL